MGNHLFVQISWVVFEKCDICSRGWWILQLVSYSSLQVRLLKYNEILQRIVEFFEGFLQQRHTFKVCSLLLYLKNSFTFLIHRPLGEPENKGKALHVEKCLIAKYSVCMGTASTTLSTCDKKPFLTRSLCHSSLHKFVCSIIHSFIQVTNA